MAEGVGFEPTEPFGSPVFKTGAIDHSTTPPVFCVPQRYARSFGEIQEKLFIPAHAEFRQGFFCAVWFFGLRLEWMGDDLAIFDLWDLF